MKKLKTFWQNNSVLLVLLLILIACLIAISVVVVTYFVGDSNGKYGDRLEGTDKHPITDKIKDDITSKIKEDKLVLNVSIRTSGKVVYINMKFDSAVSLVEAQSKALASLEYFNEDILSFYDLNYLIEADSTEKTDGFQMMGSHNVSGTGGIVWNNNTAFDKEEK